MCNTQIYIIFFSCEIPHTRMKELYGKAQAVTPVRQHFVIFHAKCWWVFTGELHSPESQVSEL